MYRNRNNGIVLAGIRALLFSLMRLKVVINNLIQNKEIVQGIQEAH